MDVSMSVGVNDWVADKRTKKWVSVSEWASEWVSEWASDRATERVSQGTLQIHKSQSERAKRKWMHVLVNSLMRKYSMNEIEPGTECSSIIRTRWLWIEWKVQSHWLIEIMGNRVDRIEWNVTSEQWMHAWSKQAVDRQAMC
jgi:hypothetical protein